MPQTSITPVLKIRNKRVIEDKLTEIGEEIIVLKSESDEILAYYYANEWPDEKWGEYHDVSSKIERLKNITDVLLWVLGKKKKLEVEK